ncbi:MAG: universal stress protein [Dehalococcoidia bacterium]
MNTEYRRILLPLDGSDVAHSAVAAAAGMSRLFDSELTLVTVLPEPLRTVPPLEVSSAPAATGGGGQGKNAGTDGAAYLMRMADELKKAGVSTNAASIVNPDAATEIVLTARDREAELIVMATRGRSGIIRGVLGSVTDRVIHSSPVPVMVAPVKNNQDVTAWTPGGVIVPLDGSELAESALPYAESIARAGKVPITLVRAVSFPTAFAANTCDGVPMELVTGMEEEEREARRYLSEIATRLRARGHRVETHIGSGHPRSEIAEAGAVSLELEEAHMVDLAGDAVRRAIRSRLGDGRVIDVDISLDLPLLYVDPVQIGRVLDNLISNALKYSDGQIKVHASLGVNNGTLETAVIDSGIGLAPEIQSAVFEKFFRVTDAGRKSGIGAGLGLAICKAIVESHGGEIGVASKPGMGGRFSFTLPLQFGD